MADATVSKTVERRLSCRFDPDLRHHTMTLPRCVEVAQRTLNPFTQVRFLARQPLFSAHGSDLFPSSFAGSIGKEKSPHNPFFLLGAVNMTVFFMAVSLAPDFSHYLSISVLPKIFKVLKALVSSDWRLLREYGCWHVL